MNKGIKRACHKTLYINDRIKGQFMIDTTSGEVWLDLVDSENWLEYGDHKEYEFISFIYGRKSMRDLQKMIDNHMEVRNAGK